MKKIKISKKFKELCQKGTSIALILGFVGTFSACGNDTPAIEENTTEVSTTITNDIPTTLDDTILLNESSCEAYTPTEIYDWEDIDSILSSKNNNYYGTMYIKQTNGTRLSTNKYTIATFLEEDEFSDTYERIVDNEGNYLDDKKYTYSEQVNDHTILMREKNTDTKEDNGIDEEYTYTILNQITGEKKQIISRYVSTFKGYIIKGIKVGDDYKYQLLNDDCSKAIHQTYKDINTDWRSNLLFLTLDDETNIIDTTTKKSVKIDGEVTNGYAGYIIIKKNVSENKYQKEYKEGVFYFDNINGTFKEILPFQDKKISIENYEQDNPLFSIDSEEELGKQTLINKEGKKVLDKNYDFYLCMNGIIIAYTYNRASDGTLSSTRAIYKTDGTLLDANAFHEVYDPIYGTDFAIYKFEEEEKYGILKYGNGTHDYLTSPIFDDYTTNSFYNEENEIEDVYIICRDQENNQTIIYTKELVEVDKGDYDICESNRIISEHHKDKTKEKTYTKVQQ